MKKHALIIGAAPERDKSYIVPLLAQLPAPFVICADNGVKTAREQGITPHLIIGDFDSTTEGLHAFPEVEHMCLPAEKDDTDLRVCVDEAIARGAGCLHLANVSGGRLDHYLGNLYLLEYLAGRGVEAHLYDVQNIVTFSAGGEIPVPERQEYKFFSILPLDRKLTGVVMRGFKYPLHGITVDRGTPVTISNEITAADAFIAFEGRALLIYSKD